ncbi:hypothetical protein LAZ67_5000139 [Cordylochernes scorpioides]|uniref:Uncharacterized protein n=1 Tax=Cordylochernes scorpioides TaxID=51811 RepID=A0ABY6KEV2_9ARAC|nr:hypothetical protein LAZ67_5000139 [Cordylochernes scorpioides]
MERASSSKPDPPKIQACRRILLKKIKKKTKYANPPAGDVHVNPAAARDVTAPPTAASSSATTASPASPNWADSEMAEVDANEGYTVVKSKKRRLSSTPEHAANQGKQAC